VVAAMIGITTVFEVVGVDIVVQEDVAVVAIVDDGDGVEGVDGVDGVYGEKVLANQLFRLAIERDASFKQ